MGDRSVFLRRAVPVRVELEDPPSERTLLVRPVSFRHADDWNAAWSRIANPERGDVGINKETVLAIVKAGLPEPPAADDPDGPHPRECSCSGNEGVASIVDAINEVSINQLWGAVLEANSPKDLPRPETSDALARSPRTRRWAGWSFLASRSRPPSRSRSSPA